MSPEFPLRIIFDDGECVSIETPEALMSELDAIDTSAAGAGVWVRDALDRTVILRVRGGIVELLELREP